MVRASVFGACTPVLETVKPESNIIDEMTNRKDHHAEHKKEIRKKKDDY